MRYVYLIFGLLVVLVVSIAGFRGSISRKPPIEIFDDMDRQPKVKAQSELHFFADGRADRPIPPNTVARNDLEADDAFYRGENSDGTFIKGFPDSLVVDETLLKRGQNRFTIYCSPCHGRLADGNGITKSYGMGAVANLTEERIRNMPSGEIFNTLSHGKNTMRGYADKLAFHDRWAIVAYVRALQLASHASVADVPESAKGQLGLK